LATISRTADGRLQLSRLWVARAMSWPIAAMVVIVHMVYGHPGFPPDALLCAGLLGALAVLTIAYAKPHELPVLPVMVARIYFAMGYPAFGAPRMVTALGPIRLSSSALLDATFGGLLFASLIVGIATLIKPYTGRLSGDWSRALDRRAEYDGTDTITARMLAAISIAIHLMIAASPTGQRIFGSFGYLATLLGGPAISLGLLFWDMEQRPTFMSRTLFWSAAGALSLAGFITGMLGSALEPFIDTIIFLWTFRGRIPVFLITVSIAALLSLNHAKHAYRRLTWNSTHNDTFTRLQNWATAIEQTYGGDASYAFEVSAGSTARRLSTLLAVAHIFEWVPARIPHAGPKAWLELPLQYVPRVFWANKPSPAQEFNNRYTVTFRLQTVKMTQGATFNLPSIGDGYWRLGWLGVVLEGVFLGLLAGFYVGVSKRNSRALLIIGTGFVMTTGPEGYVLYVLGSQPQYWLSMIMVLALAQTLPSLFAGAPKTKLIRVRPRAPIRVFK
jgi:hypothetical protein